MLRVQPFPFHIGTKANIFRQPHTIQIIACKLPSLCLPNCLLYCPCFICSNSRINVSCDPKEKTYLLCPSLLTRYTYRYKYNNLYSSAFPHFLLGCFPFHLCFPPLAFLASSYFSSFTYTSFSNTSQWQEERQQLSR